ncbi:MAG TPA: hypothetical protein VFK06_21275 [Candidatus Angelobacter sp.]|nr:hypothetical protein [Candidatus Angelobacter sp.]
MMKKFFSATLALGMLATSAAFAAQPAPAPAPVQKEKGGEQHPHIRTALRELREAKKELQTAAHDFGGHRKEAIEAVDNAIKQLQEALEYDKK